MAGVPLVVLSCFLLVLPSATAIGKVCGNAGNYTANGTYQSNLAFLAATLPSNTSSSPQLFATATAGQAPGDVVYALALCRGDLTSNLTECSACVNGSFQYAQRMCPNAKAASVYDDDCLVGYSSDNILVPAYNVTRDMSTLFNYWNNAATTPGGNATQVAADVKDLLTQTAQQAAARPSRFVTAYMDASSTAIRTLYSLAQCTPDLSAGDCLACLRRLVDMVNSTMALRMGAQIHVIRCYFRYEAYQFYDSQPMLRLGPVPAPAPTPTILAKHNRKYMVVISAYACTHQSSNK